MAEHLTDLSAGLRQPEWVMCGCTGPLGVRVIASKKLPLAELEMRVQRQAVDYGGIPAGSVATGQQFTLKVWMLPHETVFIDGPDYGTVIEALFRQWSPQPEGRPGIGTGAREIEAASGER